MQIRFVTRGIEMYRGGGETYLLNIAKALEKINCKIKFFTTKPIFGNSKYPVDEFETHNVSCPYLRDLSQRLMHGSCLLEYMPFKIIKDLSQRMYKHIGYRIYNFDNFLSQKRLFNFIKRNKTNYDILQVHALTWLASRAIDEFQIPVVIRFPGPPSIKYKKEIQKCSAVIASGDAVNIIKKNFRDDVHDIPPGIDCSLFKHVKNDIRERYNVNDNLLLLFVGRFVPLKNLPFLIKSFKEVLREYNRVRLMLVGEGPLDKIVRHLVAKNKLGKKVIFAGRVPPEQLPQYYSAADVFIITSIYDNFPNAVLEAMACELPIIGTRVGGIIHQVKNAENGFIVENNDIKGLKNTILNLLSDKRLCKEMGKRNREMVEKKYSWLESAKKFKRIYESLL